ncbi:MAG: response regulator transcription factor [Gammaproteobacteria bacterium]|nr:response regulator transcription factor [Gammaproteobacteria bacterium]
MAIKTIIVDDHPVVRFGVKQMLSSSEDIEVVAEMDDVDNLLQVLKDTDADIVLLDLELEHTTGVDALRLVRENAPGTKVIIYTSHDEEDRIVQAAELGVDGYLLKGCGQTELVNAIHSVSAGGIALESTVAGKLMNHMNQRSSTKVTQTVQFSKREAQVLELLSSGKTNRDIGVTLFISESTVKFHVHAILNKLDASNRTEAVSIAAQLGLVELT